MNESTLWNNNMDWIVVMPDSKQVTKQQEHIQSFFEEATSELLYNIVHNLQDDEGEFGYKKLSEEIEEKVGEPLNYLINIRLLQICYEIQQFFSTILFSLITNTFEDRY